MAIRSPYQFRDGARDGLPIALGYLSVSFSIGIMAMNLGLPLFAAVLMSATNLTSAGQVAGLAIIAAAGSWAELALSQLVINSRYALMSLSLSQKLDDSFSLSRRLLAAFGITDEIFVLAAGKEQPVGARYMCGLILIPWVGWTCGTLLGAAAGEILPAIVKAALGIAIYGMFIALIVPAASRDRRVLIAVLIAAALSLIIRYVPCFAFITEGFAMILCAILASVLMAALAPRRAAGEKQE